MATCELTIELDQPEVPRKGGEPVSGTIVVRTTDPVKCNGLELTSCWVTHGRGNVDKGDVDECVVFEGQWDAQREYRYPFTLKTAIWPPTYYGTYLNVSHLVRARARVPWSSDPKTEVEFPVVAASAPEDLKPTVAEKKKSNVLLGWILGVIVLVFLGVALGMLFLFLVPLLLIGGACYWFFRVFLPSQVTGLIECSIEPLRLAAGDTVHGRLRFTPKRTSAINGIQCSVTCVEKCESGSGSSRTTHRYEVFKQTKRLAEAGPLRVGETRSLEFDLPLPHQAPPSLKFSNNELNWSGEVRIDIPRWPDWVHAFKLTVVPSEAATTSGSLRSISAREEREPRSGPAAPVARLPSAEEEAWFDEFIQQVVQSRSDPNRMQTVLAAVRDHVFTIRVDVGDELDSPPASANGEDGAWMLAHYRARDMEMGLVWSSPDRLPAACTFNWCGQATVIGYDHELDCLLMRVLDL